MLHPILKIVHKMPTEPELPTVLSTDSKNLLYTN